MNLHSLQQEVQKRVSEKILEHLFPVAVNRHANHAWKEACTCEYCSAKRTATHDVKFGWYRAEVPVSHTDSDAYQALYDRGLRGKQLRRHLLKTYWRDRLNKLKNR